MDRKSRRLRIAAKNAEGFYSVLHCTGTDALTGDIYLQLNIAQIAGYAAHGLFYATFQLSLVAMVAGLNEEVFNNLCGIAAGFDGAVA